jgi:GEVED domain/Secretion system C-terminal sorting domain
MNACGNNWDGETEDYVITIGAVTPCTGTPTVGTLTSSHTKMCASDIATLQLNGVSINTGIHTVWQTSANGTTGWTATGDSTTFITTIAPTDSMYYRVAVDCNGGTPVYSNVIKITLNTLMYACYCQSTPSYGTIMNIGGVTVAMFSNNQSLTPVTNNTTVINKYTNFTSLGTIGIAKLVINNPISVTQINQGLPYPAYVKAYIDYDQSGSFDNGEEVLVDTTYKGGVNVGTNVVNGTFTVPPTAINGITGMRFIMSYYPINSTCAVGSSNNYDYGETEDYLVSITDSVVTGVVKTLPTTVNFVAYPNPTMDLVTIALQGNTNSAVKCEVLNNLGQVVYSNTTKQLNGVEKLKVDLSGYASGSYMIRVIANNNVSVKRILLQR